MQAGKAGICDQQDFSEHGLKGSAQSKTNYCPVLIIRVCLRIVTTVLLIANRSSEVLL